VTTVRAHWRLAIVIALVTAGALLSLTACSSSESSGGSAGASDAEQAMLDFVQCMRDNGVPSFPDPVARPDGSFGLQRPVGVPASVLDNAFASCRSEAQAIGLGSDPSAPDTDAQDQLLKLSRCMRKNGIPEFPDPEPGSDLISGLHGLFSGFDLESPRVARALESCRSVLNQLFGPGHGG
jgi:hypothetical protein